jgi:hypothetical protein
VGSIDLITESEAQLSEIEDRIGRIEQKIFELERVIAEADLRQAPSAPAERVLRAARDTRSLLLVRREAVQLQLDEAAGDRLARGPDKDPPG